MYKECAPVERFLKHTSQQTVIEKYTCLNFSSEQETLQLCERDREIEKEQRGKKVGKVFGDQKNLKCILSEMRVKNLVSTHQKKNIWMLNIYENLNFEFALCTIQSTTTRAKRNETSTSARGGSWKS